MAKSRTINAATPAGAALILAFEMHERKIISIADLRCFEAALMDLADKEADALDRPQTFCGTAGGYRPIGSEKPPVPTIGSGVRKA